MEAVKLLRLNANSAKLPHQIPKKHKVGVTDNNPLESKQSFVAAMQSSKYATGYITDTRSALNAYMASVDSGPVRYNAQVGDSGPVRYRVQAAETGLHPVSNMASDEEILSYAGESFSRH